jgi:hypothetical protein
MEAHQVMHIHKVNLPQVLKPSNQHRPSVSPNSILRVILIRLMDITKNCASKKTIHAKNISCRQLYIGGLIAKLSMQNSHTSKIKKCDKYTPYDDPNKYKTVLDFMLIEKLQRKKRYAIAPETNVKLIPLKVAGPRVNVK